MQRMTCTGCRKAKPIEEFGPDDRRASGRRSRCRECDARAARQRRAEARRPPADVVAFPPRSAPVEAVEAPSILESMTADLERHLEVSTALVAAEAALGRGRHAKALETALAKLGTDGLDAAATELARTLARAMDAVPADDPHQLALIAPKYGAALKSLGLTRDSTARTRPDAGEKSTKLARFY